MVGTKVCIIIGKAQSRCKADGSLLIQAVLGGCSKRLEVEGIATLSSMDQRRGSLATPASHRWQ